MPKHFYKGREYQISYRDSQRQKVYDGEGGMVVKDELPDRDLATSQRYVDHIVKSATWKRLLEQHHRGTVYGRKVEVRDGRGRRSACAYPAMMVISLPVWSRRKSTVLHELAHILVGNGIGHHWPFCRAFIDLVAIFVSKEEAVKLEQRLKETKARTRPPRQMSEEAKRALAERGRLALGLVAKPKKDSEA